MDFRKLAAVTALSALALGAAPAAQAAPPLGLGQAAAVERAGAEPARAAALRGTTGWVIGAVALALIVWGVIELLDDGTDAVPASP